MVLGLGALLSPSAVSGQKTSTLATVPASTCCHQSDQTFSHGNRSSICTNDIIIYSAF